MAGRGFSESRLLCILIAATTLIFFSRLSVPLQEPEESRYAEIPRQMLESGHFLVPVLHGQPYYDKPPLLYWLVMACYALFGVEDGVARIVPAAASFLTILAAYGWARQTVGVRAAFIGAVMLCLSARFVYLSRLLTMNSLLALWVVAAWAAAHLAIREVTVRWRWWLVSALATGLGLLTKGPVALALVVPPILGLPWFDRRLVRPRLGSWLVYVLIAGSVAVPWYAAVSVGETQFGGYFFWKHNVERFLSPFDHEAPFWFYLPGLLAMLPLAVPLALIGRALGRSKPSGEAASPPAALGFFLASGCWCLVFFSVAGCKRAGYLLPAVPPLALALGWYLDRALSSMALQDACFRWGKILTFGVLGSGAAGAVAAVVVGVTKPLEAAAIVAVCATAIVLLWSWRGGWSATASWGAAAISAGVLLFAAIHLALPGYARRFSMRGFLRPHEELVAGRLIPIVCYPRRWDSVSFYLRRSDVRECPPNQRAALFRELRDNRETILVVRQQSLDELLRELPASLTFEPLGRRGRVTVGRVRPRREVPAFLLVRQ